MCTADWQVYSINCCFTQQIFGMKEAERAKTHQEGNCRYCRLLRCVLLEADYRSLASCWSNQIFPGGKGCIKTLQISLNERLPHHKPQAICRSVTCVASRTVSSCLTCICFLCSIPQARPQCDCLLRIQNFSAAARYSFAGGHPNTEP